MKLMTFLWVANHPGVDLCNTRPMIDGEQRELLTRPSDLAAWLAQANKAITRLGTARPDQATLKWTQQLREQLRAVLTSSNRTAPAEALNRTLAQLTCSPQLDQTTGLILSSSNPQTQIRTDLAVLAIQSCQLPPERVRQCANPNCVLIFHDASKNGTRRWCDMATCGNREKAATHYRRTRQRHQ
jgi:predicted RNA-binding Zn ribbon-like protein